MQMLWSLWALVVAPVVLSLFKDVEAVCGYQSCPATKPHVINVHLVPHSHDELGWLKTFDQYYYGSRDDMQRANVKNILDSVIQELMKNSTRRFSYAELAFFFKWYHDQNDAMKADVLKLVNGGRLEFVGGGWSSNDEATVHYQSVIDQYTLGLKQLTEHFGSCGRARVGWLIDSYGHSKEMASIFAQMGYDGEFFTRLDWIEKSKRMDNLEGEMIWKSSQDLGEHADIFTSILYNHYVSPPGFCFDALCVDEPIVDGVSYENNMQSRIDDFIYYITQLSNKYHTNNLLVPMGDDFHYGNALKNFNNMDKLIEYTNMRGHNGSNINVFYSTPSCYLNALHKLQVASWPVKQSDFFPYSTDPYSYLTGFYSSRPTLKRYERDANHFLQVLKQLTALSKMKGGNSLKSVDSLKKMLAVMQHHNAITGTLKQHVADDYSRRLTDAIDVARQTASVALQQLTNLTHGEFSSCFQLNISVCQAISSNATNLVLTLVNPLAHTTTQYVRLPVKNGSYVVLDPSYQEIPSQIVPLPKDLLALPFRPNDTDVELVFEATVDKVANYYVKPYRASDNELPEGNHVYRSVRTASKKSKIYVTTTGKTLGMPEESYKVPLQFHKPVNGDIQATTPPTTAKPKVRLGQEIILENSLAKLSFSKTGHLTRIEMNGVAEDVRQEFFYYESANDNNSHSDHGSSGMYVFRPKPTEVPVSSRVYSTAYEGKLVKEVHQRFNDWISQVIRIYEGVNQVEFEWMVGPIPIKEKVGKEVITRFSTNINTDGVFWTDSNGREMLRRVRNEREYFKPDLKEPISSNYYPVTTRIALENEQHRFAVLTDRPQGGSSVRNGSLELMVHRRLLHDDGFGVGEILNETAYKNGLIARGKMYVILSSSTQKPSYYERLAEKEIHLPLWKFFSKSSRKVRVIPLVNFTYLPREIELLTLENYGAKQSLLRLENIMNQNETAPVTFNIRRIFDDLKGRQIIETTLDGNEQLSKMKRFKFSGSTSGKLDFIQAKHVPLVAAKADPATSFIITLDPMQIRTFLIKWSHF